VGFPDPRALVSDEEDELPIHEMMLRPVERGQKWGTRPAGRGGGQRGGRGRGGSRYPEGAGRGDDGGGAGRGRVNARDATVHTSLHNNSEHDDNPSKKILRFYTLPRSFL
jgi:hypothetical protein